MRFLLDLELMYPVLWGTTESKENSSQERGYYQKENKLMKLSLLSLVKVKRFPCEYLKLEKGQILVFIFDLSKLLLDNSW